MSKAATKTGTRRARAMELDQLRAAARRQFPTAPGVLLDRQVRKLHAMARAGRLRIGPRPQTP